MVRGGGYRSRVVVVRLEIAQISPLLVGFTVKPNSAPIKEKLRQSSFEWRRDLGRWGLNTFPFSQKSQKIVELKNLLRSTGNNVKIKELDSRIVEVLQQALPPPKPVNW